MSKVTLRKKVDGDVEVVTADEVDYFQGLFNVGEVALNGETHKNVIEVTISDE